MIDIRKIRYTKIVMPTYTDKNDHVIWDAKESKPALSVGSPKSQNDNLGIRR